MKLSVIEHQGQRVITTEQLAAMYETDKKTISYNFNHNKIKYVEGKHYICLENESLRQFKTSREFPESLKRINKLYLWTEKGALLHAKSINTDKAWEVYDWLVDFYFRVKEHRNEHAPVPAKKRNKPVLMDIPDNKQVQVSIKQINDSLIAMQRLLVLYNRYLEEDSVKGLQKAIDALGAEICIDTFRLKNIKLGIKIE